MLGGRRARGPKGSRGGARMSWGFFLLLSSVSFGMGMLATFAQRTVLSLQSTLPQMTQLNEDEQTSPEAVFPSNEQLATTAPTHSVEKTAHMQKQTPPPEPPPPNTPETNEVPKGGTVAPQAASPATDSSPMDEGIHVFLCSDEADLRPMIAAMNSTAANCRRREALVFHLLVPSRLHKNVELAVANFVPHVRVEIDTTSLNEKTIAKKIHFFNTAGARRELANPYNFASFYLAEYFSHVPRIIYFDTDVIVQGDVTDLAEMDLKGYPIAAVGDCSQRYNLYFDFKRLESFGNFDKKECVFNHGMFVMDTAQWNTEGVTEKIELWMSRFKDSGGTLYKFGLSQPPWLLALYRRYEKLGIEWNTRGLGRNEFVGDEKQHLATMGFDSSYFQRIGFSGTKPYVSPLANKAKLLHFNGRYKPWKRASRAHDPHPPSLCGDPLIDCASYWWKYLSQSAELTLMFSLSASGGSFTSLVHS